MLLSFSSPATFMPFRNSVRSSNFRLRVAYVHKDYEATINSNLKTKMVLSPTYSWLSRRHHLLKSKIKEPPKIFYSHQAQEVVNLYQFTAF